MRVSKPEREEQLERLRKWFPKGSTVYTILRHVSRSGMQRTIGVVALIPPNSKSALKERDIDIRHPNYATSIVCGMLEDRQRSGVKINGTGMDMGFEVAYRIGQAIHGDGYALSHQWL